MYIQDHSGPPEDAIAAALATAAYKKAPTVDTALKEAAKIVEKTFKTNLTALALAEVQDLVDGHSLVNGDWTSDFAEVHGLQAKSDFESALDDLVEQFCEPYTEQLSANWLGTHTIESQVWVDGGVEAFAMNFAKEVYKNLAADRTPAQMLANAGVTREAIENAINSMSEGAQNMTGTETMELDKVLAKVRKHVGPDFDAIAVYDDLDLIATEDNEILVNAAGARLGLFEDDIGVLQMSVLDMEGNDPAEVWLNGLTEPAPKRERDRKAEAARAKEAEGNTLPAEFFNALKECGAGDTAMAEGLGISRSTYTNYCKGKTAAAPDPEQYAFLRAETVTRLNKMIVALGLLDGEAHPQVI